MSNDLVWVVTARVDGVACNLLGVHVPQSGTKSSTVTKACRSRERTSVVGHATRPTGSSLSTATGPSASRQSFLMETLESDQLARQVFGFA
ncbi:hypothetical protein N7453_012345 [Penicillium expansum]|nr:hypothetical protein N7453_012345 [Penicillium expansum]